MKFNTIEEAVEDIKKVKMVILVDDEDRENEGDLTMAAEMVTPEAINFMAKYGRGLICLSLRPARVEHLQLPMIVGVPAIAPVDAALGLPEEKYTHAVRRIVAEETAKSSFDDVVELLDKRTGATVPKRQVEDLTTRAAQDFDEFYAARLREPEPTSDLLVLSFDGTGIAMRHDDLRPATRKAAETTPRTLQAGLAQGEKPNRKRMAQVATIYSLPPWPRNIADVLHGLHDSKVRDAQRPRPVNKRVWASLEHEPQHVVDVAFALAIAALLIVSGFGQTERKKEIGVLKATGWQTQEVMERVELENLVISLTSAPLAILLAMAWLKWFNVVFIAQFFIAEIGLMAPFPVPSRFLPLPCFLAFLFAIVLTVVGSLYSTWKTAAIPPVEAMR